MAGREIGTHLLHVEAKRSDFVVIEINLRLRLVDFRVDIGESEHVRLHRFAVKLLREFENSFRVGSGSDHETYRKSIAAGKRRRHHWKHLNARDVAKFVLNHRKIDLRSGVFRTPHGFKTIPPKPLSGNVI